MSKPLKQVIRFSFASRGTEGANSWLSARENEKYETEIYVTGGDYASVVIVYWETT